MEKETPKEKAKQLVDTFKPNAYIGSCEENDKLMELYHSKQCALIAVEEILNHHSQEQGLYRIDTYYWQEVKQEIENIKTNNTNKIKQWKRKHHKKKHAKCTTTFATKTITAYCILKF